MQPDGIAAHGSIGLKQILTGVTGRNSTCMVSWTICSNGDDVDDRNRMCGMHHFELTFVRKWQYLMEYLHRLFVGDVEPKDNPIATATAFQGLYCRGVVTEQASEQRKNCGVAMGFAFDEPRDPA
ncbi:hypothetical protein RvY_04501 [Ramazzottius varieornatus]|uniref:Uncharacterized protein n=1 Tax=Ramazzottius varieornatus TaxID=947166 RepID=A0A1D1V1T2_RAMVA|nr:hypothetical protein RvY_04501 [Ramazzottius varieornatus]